MFAGRTFFPFLNENITSIHGRMCCVVIEVLKWRNIHQLLYIVNTNTSVLCFFPLIHYFFVIYHFPLLCIFIWLIRKMQTPKVNQTTHNARFSAHLPICAGNFPGLLFVGRIWNALWKKKGFKWEWLFGAGGTKTQTRSRKKIIRWQTWNHKHDREQTSYLTNGHKTGT